MKLLGVHELINEVHFQGDLADVLNAHDDNWRGYSFYNAYFKVEGRLSEIIAISRDPDSDWLGIMAADAHNPGKVHFIDLDESLDLTDFQVIICIPLDEWAARQ